MELNDKLFDQLIRENDGFYVQCLMCVADKPDAFSPREWARFNVIQTMNDDRQGLQVWCVRHNVNVMHMLLPKGQRMSIVTERADPTPDPECDLSCPQCGYDFGMTKE